MKRLLIPLALALCAATAAPAFADWDPELEAREQAERDARAREDAARQREADRIRQQAEAKANAGIMAEKRKYVGAAANGKSDAEVNRLYDEKTARTTAEAYRAAGEARQALSTGQGAAAVKDVTGHSMKDIENMSDAELEALSRDMEKKYGN